MAIPGPASPCLRLPERRASARRHAPPGQRQRPPASVSMQRRCGACRCLRAACPQCGRRRWSCGAVQHWTGRMPAPSTAHDAPGAVQPRRIARQHVRPRFGTARPLASLGGFDAVGDVDLALNPVLEPLSSDAACSIRRCPWQPCWCDQGNDPALVPALLTRDRCPDPCSSRCPASATAEGSESTGRHSPRDMLHIAGPVAGITMRCWKIYVILIFDMFRIAIEFETG